MTRVVIRADASPQIGTGHVMRCVALAEALRARGASVELVGAGIPPRAAAALDRIGATLTHRASAAAGDVAEVVAATRRGDAAACWVVVDGYHFGADYMHALGRAGIKTAWVDDLNVLGRFDCDIVINPTLGAERCAYSARDETKILAGATYALLREEIRAVAERIIPRARQLVIALGGADPQQLTAHVVRAVVAAQLPDCQVIAVIGPSNPGNASVRAAAEAAGVTVVHDPADFPALLAQSALAITAAGTMAWELAALGVPSVLLAVADNQQRGAAAIREADAAEVLVARTPADVAPLTRIVRSLWSDARRRDAMARRGKRVIDGRGAGRVARWIVDGARPRDVTIRAATSADALQVWRINSEPSVRARSFDPSPIPLARHFDWFDHVLANGASRMYLFAREDEVAAQIRYDRIDADRAELSFAVASAFRRGGLGTRLLTETWRRACDDLHVDEVRGLVMRDNTASLETFRRAGFVEAGAETREGRACVVFARRAA
ncbi:MAG: UDP-2,4-diacetamido-2,4,6-trideoxy-beta-L-altropyranose hydrolase [Acidobacteria bacterium]|nr:MAG: UDP-2,4-diacetamido-2,4,6-trideoxy-beta-L-altropyranose hydrolase [Acidobacteriota bacterium]